MALIRYGGGIVQMSGSIAGDTFARNRYGNYSRARTKPINPNTGRQQAVRASVAVLTVRWSQTLTLAQRAAWNLYADNVNMTNRLGETIHLSGFNHYIRSNTARLLFTIAPVDAGPVVFELPNQDPTFALTITEALQNFDITFDNTLAWANEDNGFMFLQMGQPQNAQRNFFGGPFRTVAPIAGAGIGPPASPSGKTPPWAVAEGQRIWGRARIQRADGRLSEPFRADVFVGA